MVEYIKIETPFKRDESGTKKLIEGDWCSETLKYLKDAPFQFTEQIDGTNISVCWDGHKVTFHGRTENAQIPAPLVNYLTSTFGGDANEELFKQKFSDTHVILYGGGYDHKIQSGGTYRDDASFILFDVYLPEMNLWLTRESVEDIARTFGIDVVPIVMVDTIQSAVDFIKTSPASTIGTAKMEGLVGRPMVELKDRMGKRVITKIKVRDFV